MDFFYQGQIRRYILQTIRLLSNFSIRQNDGTLIRVPVTYGDMDRQAASVLSQNSENAMLSAPKISVYIADLELARDRIGDSTFVSKVHVRERAIVGGFYTGDEGGNYTIERLFPTPYDLKLKVDIWATNTDQKLQILEQILMFFNPSLEIQTTDNYLDWTSLSVVDLIDTTFSSKTIPVGTGTTIDIATLTLQTPIWISPPAKVKKLGIITNVITTLYDEIDPGDEGYDAGLGVSLGLSDPMPAGQIVQQIETIGNYDIVVIGKNVLATSNSQPSNYVSWYHIVKQLPGTYQAGLVKIYLILPDGSEVIGYGSINVLDETIMTISDWDPDTYPANTLIPGPARLNTAWGSFDAVLDPLTSKPQGMPAGARYLIVNSIGGGIRETFTAQNTIFSFVTETHATKVAGYKLFVDGVEVSSTVPPLAVYSNISPVTIIGDGTGATFTITSDIYNGIYSASLVNPGINYTIGSRLKVKGNFLGGTIVENDCVIYVRGVDGGGSITDFRVTGQPLPSNFIIVPDASIPVDSTVFYELYTNVDGPNAWKNSDNTDFIADANDIIEWDGTKWVVVFEAKFNNVLTYQTNLHTLVQYKWDNKNWTKSFEGPYYQGSWRIIL